jgi:hypothetical protein
MLTILLFFASMCIVGVVFIGWVIVSMARFAGRLAGSMIGMTRSEEILGPGLVCGQSRCREVNPAGARFCRRCGGAVDGAESPSVGAVGSDVSEGYQTGSTLMQG